MNLNIEKIKEEQALLQGYDSNSDTSVVAPWEYSSRSLHLGQEANVLKTKKKYSTYDNLNDIHDTNQPNITHMKKQQQKQHGDVTRRLPGDKGDCSGDNVNVSSARTSKNEAVALPAPPFIAGIKPPKAGGGDDYERNFCFDTRLSPSSSIMYHHHPHNISPSPSSSKMMLMMDNEYYDIASNNLVVRESILMKQALKSKAKKRRESIGESIATTRKRPVSSSIIPRLTKSSVIPSQQTLHKRNNSTTTLNHKRRYYSLQQPISQKDRNNLAALTNDNEEIYLQQQQQQDATAGVHWDPHIDAFEILRAKITGITRSMQEFHVQELFQDEKRKKKKLTSTTSSPLITAASRNNISNRRFSLASSNSFSTFRDDPTTNNNRLSFIGHRRIRSQSCVPLTSPHDLNEKKEYNTHYEQEEESDDDEEEEDMMNIPSPNLTALYLTTNNLIHSRLDELSETASLKSTHDDINEVSSMLVWQKKFLNLVTSCIHQSEELESLSTDVLNTEHRVRELMLINETIHEQFHEREKQYEERIRECQDVAQQQLMMIDSLEELTADINMKMESRRREIHRQEALLALDANCYKNRDENSDLLDEENNNNRWSFQKSVGDLLNMDDKHDLIQKMRWDIGMFVGGGVGTGHVIHSYEDKLNGIDMMIAGTGTTSTAIPRPYYPVDDDEYNTDDDYTSQTEVSKIETRKKEANRSLLIYLLVSFILYRLLLGI